MKKFIITISAAVASIIALGSTVSATSPPISISAINPGYTIDGVANTGEFIELRSSSDSAVPLTDLTLKYTNSSGNSSVIFEFPSDSTMLGETLLLRLASSPSANEADLVYTKTLAFSAGPLELQYKGETISSICWTGKNDCYGKFSSTHPTSLVFNEELEKFEHLKDYYPSFDPEKPSYHVPPTDTTKEETVIPKCRGLQFSEIFSYYENNYSEQFIELYNPLDHDINLDGCELKYKKKNYRLSGIIQSDHYFARYATDFKLTKNPTSSNSIELIDTDGLTIDEATYYNGQKKATAYAQFGHQSNGEEQWLQTYIPTPGEANNYQPYKTCEVGKVINEATGNCVKASSITKVLSPCPAGKYRSPITNRCRSLGSSTKELKPCAAGYERNPDTNRCRKIKQNTGAAYPLSASQTGDSNFVALGAILIIIVLALFYIAFQFRYEFLDLFRKLRLRLRPHSV